MKNFNNDFGTSQAVPKLREVTLKKVIWCAPDELEYYAPGARQHSDIHISQFVDTMRNLDDLPPIVTNGATGIIAG